ncbi:hypothetical protein [Allobranchiibius sp. GilTou38]|uniref:hypothetical protein n=1 Tax=Allobranchiibius sp. GilTou38 TaxID=2815210 RepID=UPI001AA1797A|nr:hypothetical protein [Allobranchiibius sp. GilTou38]MBO1768321.1 hypothetical protein [Allobranchiibius sp. GilTou38]
MGTQPPSGAVDRLGVLTPLGTATVPRVPAPVFDVLVPGVSCEPRDEGVVGADLPAPAVPEV